MCMQYSAGNDGVYMCVYVVNYIIYVCVCSELHDDSYTCMYVYAVYEMIVYVCVCM